MKTYLKDLAEVSKFLALELNKNLRLKEPLVGPELEPALSGFFDSDYGVRQSESLIAHEIQKRNPSVIYTEGFTGTVHFLISNYLTKLKESYELKDRRKELRVVSSIDR